MPFCCFETGAPVAPAWPLTCSIAKHDLELLTFLTTAPPSLAPAVLVTKRRASHVLGKDSVGGSHPTSFLNFLVKNNMEPRMQTCYKKGCF